MQIVNGFMMFDYPGEMFRNLIMEMGLEVSPDGYLRDQDTKDVIRYKDKYIKVSITPEPVYGGITDVVLELHNSFDIIQKLFGYYLDYAKNTEDGDITGEIVGWGIDELKDRSKQSIIVRTRYRGDIVTDYYFNILLAFCDAIFKIAGCSVYLQNLDTDTREKK